jgi:hypothetical protein
MTALLEQHHWIAAASTTRIAVHSAAMDLAGVFGALPAPWIDEEQLFAGHTDFS